LFPYDTADPPKPVALNETSELDNLIVPAALTPVVLPEMELLSTLTAAPPSASTPVPFPENTDWRIMTLLPVPMDRPKLLLIELEF
jgi:hypothetical protein